MCRILLVEDAVPEPEALRVLIEQHPCAGAIQLESCAFSQVRERVSQGPRIDALFAPVDAPGAFPACASDERAGIALVRELQDRGILPLTVYCTTRAAYTSAVYGTDHQYLLLAPYSPTEARNALDKVFGLLGHRAASPLALRSAGTVHIVDPADVVYVKSIGRKVLVRLSDVRALSQKLPGEHGACGPGLCRWAGHGLRRGGPRQPAPIPHRPRRPQVVLRIVGGKGRDCRGLRRWLCVPSAEWAPSRFSPRLLRAAFRAVNATPPLAQLRCFSAPRSRRAPWRARHATMICCEKSMAYGRTEAERRC